MNTRLIVVLPYCKNDLPLVTKLLGWIKDLGDACKDHALLLIGDNEVPKEQRLDLKRTAVNMFADVDGRGATVPKDALPADEMAKKHMLANRMFVAGATAVSQIFKGPFLWMEPDCVPITRDWLTRLATEYEEGFRPYMGSVITTDPKLNRETMPPQFMAGCGIYPNNAILGLQEFCGGTLAWDVAAARYMVPRTHATGSIQHYWGDVGKPPSFVTVRTGNEGPNVFTPDFVTERAVLFHRCKDGTLIDVLRAQAATDGKLPGTRKFRMASKTRGKMEIPELAMATTDGPAHPETPATTSD
jgi:hypothetical protein